MSTSPKPSAWLRRARGVTKLVSLLVGGTLGLLGCMALVGALVDGIWWQLGVALILLLGVPALVADRLLPDDDPAAARGLTSDVFAVGWMATAVLVVGLGISWTQPLLQEQAARFEEAGWESTAALTSWVAGGRATAGQDGSTERGATRENEENRNAR